MAENNNKFFYLASDTVFKYLFKNPNTRGFFEELIKYYTGLDISNFKFIDNELNSGNIYVDYRLDSILTSSDKSIILNIEMNRKYRDYTAVRNRRYLHTIAGTSKNNKYNDKKIVIQLNFNCYLSKDDENICTNTYMLKDTDHDLVIEDFKIHNVFIPKEEELCYNESIKKKLKLFLCKSYKEMKSIAEEDEELKSIVDEIERLNKDKYFGALYNVEEEQERLENSARSEGYQEGFELGQKSGKKLGMIEGKEEGREEGIKEGIEKGSLSVKKEIAKTMLNEKIDIGIITKCTGLTKKEINEL